MTDKEPKIKRCRYSHLEYSKTAEGEYERTCRYNKRKTRIITENACEKCKNFSSRYIEYPLTINGIENEEVKIYDLYKAGTLCKIRPCGDEYKGKTYLGIYIGELPIGITNCFKRDTKILHNGIMQNPGIFVPELKKIIYGYESWWSIKESAEDFKELTDEDIENTWYVKLLRSMEKEVKGKSIVD